MEIFSKHNDTHNFLSDVMKVVATTLAVGKPTSLFIQNEGIKLNGLITMLTEFRGVSSFWNPFFFSFWY